MAFLRKIFIGCLAVFSGALAADCSLPFCGEVGLGYDYFRSLPDGGWEGNTGGFISANGATAVPGMGSEYGFQLGASYGFYDWQGRLSAPSGKQKSSQRQLFASVGFFRETPCESGFNIGLVYDWMWNKNFGVFAVQTSIDQLRFQGGYLFCCKNEFGMWGTLDLHRSHRSSQQVPLTFRAISQINAFWRHIFDNCAETIVWAGVPYKRSLMFSTGRAGKFIVGGAFKAPLTSRLSIEGHGAYMSPHSASGALKQRHYAANICLELKWAFSGGACCRGPYMPLGNNSNFLVDTDVNF